MAEEPGNVLDEEKTGSNRTLRTCLIVGAGCAGIIVISFCILLLLGIPVIRSVSENFDWTQGQDLIEIFSSESQGTLAASLNEEFDESMLDGLEGTLEASLPDEIGGAIADALPDVNFQGIRFSYPEGEDYGAYPSVVPADLELEWFTLPEHIAFPLTTYSLADTFHEPRILVMATEDLLAVNSSVEPGLDELREVLRTNPRNIERVPFVMPGFNAAQLITAQVVYLPFQDGHGVRFVTQYGQAAWPINNHDLFYAFQGLTDDGAYLVTAVLPVTHPSLAMDGESAIGDDYEAFIAGYEDSLVGTKADLDSKSPDSFMPGLDALDAMMESIQIETP